MPDNDNDNDYEQETGPRFNKAILGRVLAVGLFVALGTFAVMQSLNGKSPSTDLAATVDDKLAATADGLGNAADKLKSGAANTASNLKTAAGNAFNKTKAALKPKDNAFAVNKNPAVKPSVVKPGGSAFAVRPAANKSGFTPLKTPVTAAKPTAPAAKKAPTRFAQAAGPPIIGNNGGFAPRVAAKPPTTFQSGSSFGAKPNVNSVGTQFGSAANKLKSNVGSAADDLLKKTGSAASNAASSFKSTLGSNSGPGARPITPPKSFGPPIVKSDFGRTSNKSSFNTNSVSGSTASKSDSNSRTFAPPLRKPTTLGNQRNLAPISANRSTQSKSTFGATSNSKSGSSQRSFGGSNFNSNRNTSSTNLQSKSSPFSNASSSNSRTNSRLGGSIRSAAPAVGLSGLSKNVPGERQLEGVQAPALTVEKISPREIQVNQTADFQLIIKNVGRVSAEDVKVFDQTPRGTEFVGASPKPTSSQGSDLRWDIGTLRPGQEKRIKLQLKPTRHGEIGSVAHVTFATQASMRTLVTKPILEIVHQSKNVHMIGDNVVFDITVKNKGDGPARNVMIQEDVPDQLEFQDGSQAIEYEIGTLLPGQSKNLRLALKAAQIGKVRNVLFASADGGLECKHELPLEVVAPNLVAKSDGPTRRFLQRNAAHTFSVANNGSAAATNVELIARLPSGLRFKGANNQGRYDANAHSVYWSLAELARDAKASVELKTTPVEIGTQPIKFETFADLEVRASIVQPLNVEHLVDVFFDIDDVVDPIEIGSDTSYKIRVVNQGTKAATNVQLGVTFPRGLRPTAVNGSIRHQINGQQIAFEPINSMSPGDELSFVIESKGQAAGDHRVVVNMKTDGRQTPVSKEETTRVYSDR